MKANTNLTATLFLQFSEHHNVHLQDRHGNEIIRLVSLNEGYISLEFDLHTFKKGKVHPNNNVLVQRKTSSFAMVEDSAYGVLQDS